MATLDSSHDYAVEALAFLCKGSVNSELQPTLGTNAIEHVFGAPLPLSLLGHNVLPALTIYRLEDRDRDKGDWLFEDTAVFRFDYFAPATPLVRLDKRWPLLRNVWTRILAHVRQGSHSAVNDGEPILPAGGLSRYVLGSARVQYSFVPGAEQTYPAFRGQLEFEGCYPEPDGFDGSALSDFETLWTDWDLKPEHNATLEAQNETKPNG